MIAATEPVIAVDIGGTKIAAARVAGATVRECRVVPTPRDGSGDSIVACIAGLMQGWDHLDRALGVATTGLVRNGQVDAVNPGTLPLPPTYPLATRLSQALGTSRLHLVNDAQAAAWGEHRFGSGVGTTCIAFVTVSTGIGGGLIDDGRLLRGPGGLAGHVGHMVCDPAGPACGCGRRGCLEIMASGRALAGLASATAGRPITTPELIDLAAAGEGWAEAILERAARLLADGLGNLRALLDVERVVLGGGVGLAPGFLARVQDHLATDLPAAFRVELVLARLGADAGLIGAADLAAAQGGVSPVDGCLR